MRIYLEVKKQPAPSVPWSCETHVHNLPARSLTPQGNARYFDADLWVSHFLLSGKEHTFIFASNDQFTRLEAIAICVEIVKGDVIAWKVDLSLI